MQSYSQYNMLKQRLYKYKTNFLYPMSGWVTKKNGVKNIYPKWIIHLYILAMIQHSKISY